MAKFPLAAIEQHIRHNHPGCPDFAVSFFANEIANRDWKRATIGKAVGITMQTFLRHEMTDYDTLLLHGMERAEARKRVQPRITAIIDSWRRKRNRPADPTSSETANMRNPMTDSNVKMRPELEKDEALTSEEATVEKAVLADSMRSKKRVGMTFNMDRDWHTKFKITAASLGMDMRQLLIESFAAWEREQK
ncbi:DUF2293 domain-containing protein [Ensifer adhaerens]|uniref:DUF2293 domain-containing protein n=1 Tax=Ensifer adhaerens TaxID=106592 RepID=UPI001C4E060F|nr:DUF2293 domain-containing protein [Ensifer adhaerens]MBW0365841.1 DUF2293 domain-containing protein [Ensifer adhaerens]UCM20254.1 DUF2293 domain-containing protein [Ensifer adhaerens]